jgi:hypothetical protein
MGFSHHRKLFIEKRMGILGFVFKYSFCVKFVCLNDYLCPARCVLSVIKWTVSVLSGPYSQTTVLFMNKWTASKEMFLIIAWHQGQNSVNCRRFYVQMNFKWLWGVWLVFFICYESMDTEIGKYHSNHTILLRANSVSCGLADNLLNKEINVKSCHAEFRFPYCCWMIVWDPNELLASQVKPTPEFMQDPEEPSSFPYDLYRNNTTAMISE